MPSYKEDYLNYLSFPLGGIGTGSIGLAGNGRLTDWQIFNSPAYGQTHGQTSIIVKAEAAGEVLDTRVLNGDLKRDHIGVPYESQNGSYTTDGYWGVGHGAPRSSMAGFPHFKTTNFSAEFPFANLNFFDKNFPAHITLEAYNPFIPLNDKDSSLPLAFFRIKFHNKSDKKIRYSAAFSVANPHRVEDGYNCFVQSSDGAGINMLSQLGKNLGGMSIFSPQYSSHQEYWYRGLWFDGALRFWKEFSRAGDLVNRHYSEQLTQNDYAAKEMCSLVASVELDAFNDGALDFVLSWFFPLYKNWNPMNEEQLKFYKAKKDAKQACADEPQITACAIDTSAPYRNNDYGKDINDIKNYYAELFSSSEEVAHYGLQNSVRLREQSNLFAKTMSESTLPSASKDAVIANLAVLKSPTILRLEGGTLYGFEGSHQGKGSCEGSCMHVWNYTMAIPFLFPQLERSMRNAELNHNLDEIGAWHFRLQLPLGRHQNNFRPCVDGSYGTIMRIFREWKISGNTEWLRGHWQNIKKAIAYAWDARNLDRWDPDKAGIIHGRQHHTLDVELFGPNAWLSGFYLGALQAASLMAQALGDKSAEKEYLSIFMRGREWLNKNLFNGEYYQHKIDLKDKSYLEQFAKLHRGTDEELKLMNFYWDYEWQEIKYQIATGCGIDQVMAEWQASIVGLPENIFDPTQCLHALRSIYKYNLKKSMREHINPCRIYALNDEAGTVICSYPREQQGVPIPYAEETQHGYEYEFACHLLLKGMEAECEEIVAAIRDKYNGKHRNPWNEIECGNHYVRSMAAYSLLIAYSGFSFDMTKKEIGFNPAGGRTGKFFWSIDGAWGSVEITKNKIELQICAGKLELKRFRLPASWQKSQIENTLGKSACDEKYFEFKSVQKFDEENSLIIFRKEVSR